MAKPPRYIRDGVDVYISLDDLCKDLLTATPAHPTREWVLRLVQALIQWKESLVSSKPVVKKAAAKKRK